MHVSSLDHLVLTVRDIERSIDFYVRALGMEARTYGKGRRALHFGTQKLNLHPAAAPVDANVRHATPGSADLCFLTDVPLEQVIAHLRGCGVEPFEEGRRTGAQGPIRSVYFYDPDENLIELANRIAE